MNRNHIGIALCTVCLIPMMCSCSSSSGVGKTGISLEEFNSISIGMDLDKVKETIGGSGTLISEQKRDTEKYIEYTSVYKYDGEQSGYAEITYVLKSYKDVGELLTKGMSRYEVKGKTQYDLQ